MEEAVWTKENVDSLLWAWLLGRANRKIMISFFLA
jgi:hypothetical protein